MQCDDPADAVLYGSCVYEEQVTGHQFGFPYCVNDAGEPKDCNGQDPSNIVGYSCGGDGTRSVQANVVCCSTTPRTPAGGTKRQTDATRKTPAALHTPDMTTKTVDATNSNPNQAPKAVDTPKPTRIEAPKAVATPEPAPVEAPKA
jgi:hypothetical protein